MHLEDRFEGIDVSFFLGSASKSTTVNSFNAGRTLERTGQSDSEKMYQVMALSAIKQAGIPTERLHADTTTISFYGEYDTEKLDLTDEERAELLQIERGYNKDGRPECRRVVVGQIVNETGIPVFQKVQDGSTSDVAWNAQAIDYLKDIQEKGFQYGVFVADSKLVTHNPVTSMNAPHSRIPFVSRYPSNFEGKPEERCILKAYSECRWEKMGKDFQSPFFITSCPKSYQTLETIENKIQTFRQTGWLIYRLSGRKFGFYLSLDFGTNPKFGIYGGEHVPCIFTSQEFHYRLCRNGLGIRVWKLPGFMQWQPMK